jgi:hypothetical protein
VKQIIKPALAILLVAYIVTWYSQSSNKTGLYKNENDFNLHKLIYEADCSSSQSLIHANNFFESAKLSVTIQDKKKVMLKKDFFGYHDCNGKDYRFYHNKIFEIMDTSSFCIYRNTSLEPNAGGKGYSTKTTFYFSKLANDDLQPLTVKTLSDAFRENVKFCFELESYASNDNALTDYDHYLKSYKVKYLFKESIK